MTDWLDKKLTNDWATNTNENFFASCDGIFQPIEGIQFRFEMSISWQINLSLMLNNDEREGSAWNIIDDKYFYSMSEWETLRKI